MNLYDVGPNGDSALIATGSGRWGVRAVGATGAQESILDLYGRTRLAGLSADGERVLLTETRDAGRGTYLRSTDGATTVRLGEDLGIGLTPDGAHALLFRISPPRLALVPTGPGPTREIALDGLDYRIGTGRAKWSLDGRRLFLTLSAANADPGAARIFVREGEGAFRPVTPEGVSGAFAVSSDGRQVATRDADGNVTLYSVDGAPPRQLEGERRDPIHWSSDGAWLFVRDASAFPARVDRLELASGSTEPWRSIGPADPTGVSSTFDLLIAGDGASYAYTFSRITNELFLVEGLR